MSHLKYKINTENKACKNNDHTFVVSTWSINPKMQYATNFTCERCLLSIGKIEHETVRDMHDCKAKELYAMDKATE